MQKDLTNMSATRISPYNVTEREILHGIGTQSDFIEPFRSETADSNTEKRPEALAVDPLDPLAGSKDGIEYKTMKWWQAGTLMLAETVSLGILALPAALAKVGLIPGTFLIIVLGILALYSGLVIGQFQESYPKVLSFIDAGEILGGKFGKRFVRVVVLLFFVFIMAAHIVTFSVMMNVLTGHRTCTVVFSLAGLVISIICTLPRTLAKISYLSIISCLSVLSAVLTVMIGLGAENGKPVGDIDLVKYTSFASMIMAILNITIAYSGNVAFFSFIAELKNPRDFKKSLFMLQITAIVIYVIVASILYCYVGRNVPSPALGAASPIVRKIAYGLATPTIIIAGVVNGAVAIKLVYLNFWERNVRVVSEKSFRAIASWVTIVLVMWIASWLLAEVIPIFEDLLSLISALFGSWFTFGSSGFLWFHLHRGRWFAGVRQIILASINLGMILLAAAICGLGLWASIKDILDEKLPAAKPFSCADNAPPPLF